MPNRDVGGPPMKSRLCAALLLAAVLPVVAACGRGSQEKAESQQPPDNVAKPKWADLFFPPNGYVYFNGPQLKPSDPPEQKAHWLVDAAILAYGCHRDENAGPTCQFYSDAELQSQFVRGGFTDSKHSAIGATNMDSSQRSTRA